MRTIVVTFFLFAISLAGITTVQAQTSGTTGPLTWTVSSDNTTLTISGNGAMPDYVMGVWGPWMDPFFEYLTTIVIEEGVTTIGNYAFYGFSQLTSVTIPNSVTSIGELAFSYCTNLTSVNLPPDLTHIVMGAFFGCYKLASITLPEKVTSIGELAFYQCYSLTAITIPNSVTSLGKDAFNRCSSLASVTIGSGITSIGQGVFSYCTALASITIPSNITSIGHVAFRGCSSLCRVTIGSGVTRIEPLAFLECGALASIRVVSITPPSVADFNGIDQTSCILKVPTGAAAAYRAAPLWQNFTTINEIEDVASGTAGTLTWVLTSDGTLTISGYGAMPDFSSSNLAPWSAYCSTIKTVVIDDGVTSIGNAAFNPYAQSYPLLSQVSIPNSVTRIGKYAFMFCKVLSTVTIPNSVTSIEYAAFAYCQALTSITIPNSVTSIADDVFESCKALTSVTIPNSLTSIGNNVFSNCQALTSIAIPNNVTSIGDGAFSSCIKLESITIVSSVTVIGIGAFWNCSKLASVTIGSGVTYIDQAAFYDCSALTQLNVKAVTPPVVENSTFTGVNSSCVLEVPFGSKNLYRSSYYWNYFTTINEITDPDLASSVVSASVASSTSITINGRITNSSTEGISANYYFIYGTDPNNLNQTTAMQGVTVPGSGSLNVSTTITGLTNGTLYYYKLVAGGNESATGKLFLSTSIPASNLTLWLRSDQAVTSSGSSVSGWGDLSCSNNDASQSTSGNQPSITSSAINGYPALSFNGTTSKLTLPTSDSLGMQSNPYELFIVAKSGSGTVQFLLAGGATEQFEYHLNGAVGARFIPVTSVLIDQGTAGAYTNGNAHVFSARTSTSGGVVRVDGNDVGTTGVSTLSSNSGNLLLGARSDNTYYFDGYVAEVIIYNTNLSSADRNSVEQYLAERYQIAGMNMPEFTSTSFTITEDTSFSGLLATDADGDVLAYTIVANALNGTTQIENDSLFYQPGLNFNGTDSLRISVSDGIYSDTAWVQLTVTPVNDSPVARDSIITANTATAIMVSLPVSDVDGSISAVFIDRQPNNGGATISGNSISYTSDAGFSGNDTLTWHAQDNEGALSNTATLIVSVVPLLPVDLAVADSTITGGSGACFDAENDITVAGSSLVVVENSASVNFIAGQSVTFLPGFHAVSGSSVHAWITEDGSFCDEEAGSIALNPQIEKNAEIALEPIIETVTGIEKQVKVYPNPNNGRFTLQMTNFGVKTEITVFNLIGKVIYHATCMDAEKIEIDLPIVSQGIYSVRVVDAVSVKTSKMIVK
jgi:hypothetical protein